MPLELQEVQNLVDADRNPVEKEVIETAIQVMLAHQIVYEDTPGVPREVFATLRRHRLFFERYFSAAGFRFRVESREQMICLEVGDKVYGWRRNRLKKDETLVRLALRLLFDRGLDSGSIDDTMRIATDTDEIVDVYRNLAQAEPPPEARLAEILHDLHRIGAVRIGDRDKVERVTELILLPGLTVHVPDPFIERVVAWTDQGCPGEVLEFMADRHKSEDPEASGDVVEQDELKEAI